ncbi:Transmembrane protein [Dirofilaria immitis]
MEFTNFETTKMEFTNFETTFFIAKCGIQHYVSTKPKRSQFQPAQFNSTQHNSIQLNSPRLTTIFRQGESAPCDLKGEDFEDVF